MIRYYVAESYHCSGRVKNIKWDKPFSDYRQALAIKPCDIEHGVAVYTVYISPKNNKKYVFDCEPFAHSVQKDYSVPCRISHFKPASYESNKKVDINYIIYFEDFEKNPELYLEYAKAVVD